MISLVTPDYEIKLEEHVKLHFVSVAYLTICNSKAVFGLESAFL
jgi:hypothetical protein